MSDPAVKYDSMAGLFLRLFCIFGPVLVVYAALYSYFQRAPVLGPSDWVLFVLTGALIVARYVDIRFLQGVTLQGEPATLAHAHRYALVLLLVTLALWLLAHGLGAPAPEAPAPG